MYDILNSNNLTALLFDTKLKCLSMCFTLLDVTEVPLGVLCVECV